MKQFLHELKHRKVYTVAIAYIAVTWLLLQLADILLPTFEAPNWVMQAFTIILALGFPLALLLAWVYDLTPKGIVRTQSLTALAELESHNAANPQGDRPFIAVLPLRNLSGDSNEDLFAESLSLDIVSGLTRYSEIQVFSSGSPSQADVMDKDLIALGQKLGVNFLLRGSVRKAGQALRVGVNLMDAKTGVEIWSETYERQLDAENLFALQDDIRERIVASLADYHGVIFSLQSQRNQDRPTNSLKAWECMAVALAYDKYPNQQTHLKARESLEHAVELDPNYDEAHAHLSWIYTDEWLHDYNLLPKPMERALDAAQLSVRKAPNQHHNRWLLSRVYYFQGDRNRFMAEAERSLALNSNDGTTIGLLGLYISWAGEWDRGISLLRKAASLNPNHPDYYYFGFGLPHLAKGDAKAALSEFQKTDIPEWLPGEYFLAAAHEMAGNKKEAKQHRQNLQRLAPGHFLQNAEKNLSKQLPFQPNLVTLILDCLRG